MSEIQNAQLDWLHDGTPVSRQFNDIYFSSQGGLAESEHVFISGNDLKSRWLQRRHVQQPFRLVELGFGTGLNFLLCWRLLESLALDNLRVHYLAFEKYPLSVQDLQRAQALWPELATLSARFLTSAIDHTAGIHRLTPMPNLTLDLYFGDALEGMSDMLTACDAPVDCWFLDGFAPARNPDLWSDSVAQLMWRHSWRDTTASTYSVAGQVRRSLQKAGFKLERKAGFGRKREMLVAKVADPAARDRPQELSEPAGNFSWRPADTGQPIANEAVIIGAGLAGCSTAYSLARRGWQVTLVEQAPNIAAGASGNPFGVLQPRLAADRSVESRFYLHALLHAHRQFNQLQQVVDIGWHPDGIVRIPEEQRPGLKKILNNPAKYYQPAVLTSLSQDQASEKAGLPLSGKALYLYYGGWLRPMALCEALLDFNAPNLKLLTRTKVTALQRVRDQWQVLSDGGILTQAPVVILCNSYVANTLPQTGFIPLQPVRGQLTRAPVNSSSSALRKVVVAGKYICPADQGMHGVGASYQNMETDITVNAAEDTENLQGIDKAFASPARLGLQAADSRASIRCNAADYFPVVGAVPDYHSFAAVFAPLKRNADARITQRANFQPGLYINSAHGSYGLASCPLSAEYLASLINRETLPVTPAMAASLSPARFIIRALKKQQAP